jgi:hypothetical protein
MDLHRFDLNVLVTLDALLAAFGRRRPAAAHPRRSGR